MTEMPHLASQADMIDHLAGITSDSPLAALRARRPEVVRHAQGSYLALLEPDDPAGVSHREREMIALRVAVLHANLEMTVWHRDRLRALGATDADVATIERFPLIPAREARETAILRHTDLLTWSPGAATPLDIADLKAVGLGPRDIVTIAQLIAYLSFEVRVLAGLRVLATPGTVEEASTTRESVVSPKGGFTIEPVQWLPWIETIDETGATPEQAELVAKVAPNPDSRAYYALLAHDLPALRERTALFNAIMYGHGGASRAERELATVATSRINGCIYCASVHARRYAQLTKDTTLVQRLLDQSVEAELGARERALVDYAVTLTRNPAALATTDLAPLHAAGFADAEILDLTLATAMFAWANRLMQTIGESVPPTAHGT